MTKMPTLVSSPTPSTSSESSVFRAAQNFPDQPTGSYEPADYGTPSQVLIGMPSLEPSFTSFQAVEGIPFVASYFNLAPSYEHLSRGDKQTVEQVERFIDGKVRSREYADSTDAAKKILSDMEEKLGLSDVHDPHYRIEKIADYLRVAGVPAQVDPLQAKEQFKELKKNVLDVVRGEDRSREKAAELRSTKAELKRSADEKAALSLAVKERDRQIARTQAQAEAKVARERSKLDALAAELTRKDATVAKLSRSFDELGSTYESDMARASKREADLIARAQVQQRQYGDLKSKISQLLKPVTVR